MTGDEYIPVDPSDVFDETPTPSGSETFKVEFDPDEGVKDNKVGAGTSSDEKEDENENHEAFGEVFIESPNPQSVSSLDLTSDWVVTGCHPTSDQPQTVRCLLCLYALCPTLAHDNRRYWHIAHYHWIAPDVHMCSLAELNIPSSRCLPPVVVDHMPVLQA